MPVERRKRAARRHRDRWLGLLLALERGDSRKVLQDLSSKARGSPRIRDQEQPAGERLEASGSFSAMCTHRVRVTSLKDVDAQLLKWLKKAYASA